MHYTYGTTKRIIMTTSKFQNFLKRTGLDEKPFQIECYQWCLDREAQHTEAQHTEVQHTEVQHTEQIQAEQHVAKTNGGVGVSPSGVLALEMGLGKTIIMLGLIECNFKKNTLIILPLSLLDQWEKCIQKFFGH